MFQKVGGSSLSLNRSNLDNSQASPLPPTKPQRSLGVYQTQSQGNENLFKFDLNIEKQEFKRNSKALVEQSYDVEVSDKIENSQKSFQDEQEKNIRKKEKKAKGKNKEKKEDVPSYERDKSKHNDQMAENDSLSITHETKSTSEDVNHLASDKTKTFQTYSDDDNEDFVVDDIIETVESESEDDVEISQSKSMGVYIVDSVVCTKQLLLILVIMIISLLQASPC